MTFEVKGTLVEVGDLQEFKGGSFKKKVAVVRIDETSQYPQEIPIDVVNKRLGILDDLSIGDVVSIDANLLGSEYNGKRFVSLSGWRATTIAKRAGSEPQSSDNASWENDPPQAEPEGPTSDDDPPF